MQSQVRTTNSTRHILYKLGFILSALLHNGLHEMRAQNWVVFLTTSHVKKKKGYPCNIWNAFVLVSYLVLSVSPRLTPTLPCPSLKCSSNPLLLLKSLRFGSRAAVGLFHFSVKLHFGNSSLALTAARAPPPLRTVSTLHPN